MLYVIIAICSILFTFLILFPKLKYTQKFNTEIDKQNQRIKQENEELIQQSQYLQQQQVFLKAQKEEIQNSIDSLKNQAQQSADIFYQQSMKIAEQQLESAEKGFTIAREEMTKEYQEILKETVADFQEKIEKKEKELADLKAKTFAAIEAAKRQEELENKLDYYRVKLSEDDKNEIEAILSIKHLISNKRSLLMLIWSNYYQKKVSELAARVFVGGVTCGIYKITNIQTQQVYIGQSNQLRERLASHFKFGIGIDTPGANKLYISMQKYGMENFTFELLEQCSVNELDLKEKYWITFYDSYTNGLNSNRGNNPKKG